MSSRIPWASKDLQHLVADSASRIFRECRRLSLVLQPYHLQDLKSAVRDILADKFDKYDTELGGIVLDFEHLKIVNNSGNVAAETSGVVVDVQADLYIFRPEVGCTLRGVVNKISKDHVGVLLYKRFNVTCPRPDSESKSSKWLGNGAQMHQEVTFKLKERNFSGRLPYFKGKLLACGKVSCVTINESQESLKRTKKSKKNLIESEAVSSTPLNDKELQSMKTPKETNNFQDNSKKRKLADPTSEELAFTSPNSKKKKRVSLASVDEVDFFPPTPTNESFLMKSMLPDQFSSPMANSTHFDIGKLLSSHKKAKDIKKSKDKVGGLTDIEEEFSNANKSVPSNVIGSVQESHVSETKSNKKSKDKKSNASATLSSVPAEKSHEIKAEKAHKKEKKIKAQGDSTCESSSVSLPHQLSIDSKSLKKKGKEDKRASQIIQSFNSEQFVHTQKGELEQFGKSSKKNERKQSDSVLYSTEDLLKHGGKSSDKKEKTKRKDKVMDESSFYRSNQHAAEVLPQVSGKLNKKKISGEIENSLDMDNMESKKHKSVIESDSPLKKPKKQKKADMDLESSSKEKIQSKSVISVNDKMVLSTLIKNLENNFTAPKIEEISTSKKQKKAQTSASTSLRSDMHFQETVSKGCVTPIENSQVLTESKSEVKKKSKQITTEHDSDLESDDLIPPGQRHMLGSPLKNKNLSKSGISNSPVGFFPSDSLFGRNFGKGLEISPMIFGGIPDIRESSVSSGDSDSDDIPSKRVSTDKMKIPITPAKSSEKHLASSADSAPIPSARTKSVSSSKLSSSRGSSLTGQKTAFKDVESSKPRNLFNATSLSKLVSPSSTPRKPPTQHDSSSISGSDVDPQTVTSSKERSHSKSVKLGVQPVESKSHKSFASVYPSKPQISETPKKILQTGIDSDSDESNEETRAPAFLQRTGSESEKSSSESESENPKVVTGRFLQSMGVIDSPLTSTQKPAEDSSDSDSDSSFDGKKEQKSTQKGGSPGKLAKKAPGNLTKDLKPTTRNVEGMIAGTHTPLADPEGSKNIEASPKISKKSTANSKSRPGSSQLIQSSKRNATQPTAVKSTKQPSSLSISVGEGDSDSDLELMRNAVLALKMKELEKPPTRQKQTQSKKGKSPSEPVATLKPLSSNNPRDIQETVVSNTVEQGTLKAGSKKTQRKSKPKASSSTQEPSSNKVMKRGPEKNAINTAKESTVKSNHSTSQLSSEPIAPTVGLKSQSSTMSVKVSRAIGDDSDSDSGPDDKNTTQGLEEHRQEVLQMEQEKKRTKKAEIEQKKAISSRSKKPEKQIRASKKSTQVLVQPTEPSSNAEEGTKKASKVKGKLKKQPEVVDECSDIIRRLMERAHLNLQ